MALTPPTVSDLATYRNEPFAAGEEVWAGSVLQQATDAVWVFTGLDELPTDPRAVRILQNALLDLTLWLMSQAEHRDEINSPFSGERIGSYSYQKMQQAQQGESGLYWLDMLFRLLKASDGSAEVAWVTSESVFTEPYCDEEQVLLHDPSITGWV
jgi:hypothetical protein